MPQVPQIGPEVTPTLAPPATYLTSGDSGPDTFGAGLGAALEKTGDTTGARAISLQSIANEAKARDLSVQAETSLATEKANMLSKSGQDAINYQSTFAKNINDIRTSFLGQAPNPDVKQMLDQQIARSTSYAISGGIDHVATQTMQYNKQTVQARVANSINSAGDTTVVGQELADQYNIAKHGVDDEAQQDGLSPESKQLLMQKTTSAFWKQRIMAVSENEPERAAKLLGQVPKGDLDIQTQTELQHRISDRFSEAIPASVADKVISGGPMQTKSDRENYAMTRATNILGANGAAGLVGNLGHESQLDPNSRAVGDQRDGSDSVGIANWGLDRKKALEDYAASKGLPWNDYKTQVQFSLKEISDNPQLLKELQDAKTPEQAAIIVADEYERPKGSGQGNPLGIIGIDDRIGNANRLAGTDLKPIGLSVDSNGGDLLRMQNEARQQTQAQIDDVNKNSVVIGPADAQKALDASVARVETRFNQVKAAHNEQIQGDLQTLSTAMLPDGDKPGPATVEDVRASSDAARQAYDRLPPKQKIAFNKALANIASNPPITPEMIDRREYLKGLAGTDPQQFVKDTESDLIVAENMPKSWKMDLVNDRQKILDNASAQPKMSHALGVLTSEHVVGPGASIDPKANPKRYATFAGALSVALSVYKSADGMLRDPTDEEIKSTAAKLLTKGPGFLGTSIGSSFPFEGDSSAQVTAGINAARSTILPDNVSTFLDQDYAKVHPGQKLSDAQKLKLWSSQKNQILGQMGQSQ